MRKIILTVITLSLGLAATSNAQLNAGVTTSDQASIIAKVNALFGAGKYDPYSIDIINVDSTLEPNKPFGVEDPYHILEHCYVFLAAGKMQTDGSVPKGFVGVYKDGNIIWHSPTVINSDGVADAGINTILDMNKEGTVDIVTGWKWGGHGEADYIWIFSWDGQQGTPLNLYDSTGHSNLVSYTDEVQLVDLKGDGVLEIQGKWKTNTIPANEISVLYAWNGQNYVSVDTLSFGSAGPPPRNKVQVAVQTNVIKANDSLYFSYTIENKRSSLQKIENFILTVNTKSLAEAETRQGWKFLVLREGKVILWMDWFFGTNLIAPGSEDHSLSLASSALPSISKFYIQGNNGMNNLSDIYTNSFEGYTLGPADPPSPFVPSGFLDTLTSYTTQSRSLGWIKDQATADKYSGYLASAKTSLQQNNIGAARSTLQQVLQQANTDSTSNLTSEAYALIRYNTEYLLAQLPVPPSGFMVKLINSTGTKLTSGSLQYYEGSWKDATNNNDGTFTINTTSKTLSLRMTYEFGTQTKSNVAVGPDTAVFQTVDAQIKLQDSKGNPLDTGTIQYYAGAWRNLGATINGVAAKELLPNSYSFRMTYASESNDRSQDIGANPVVVFQTVNAAVQLQDSHGSLIDQGTVQYYSGAWRDFGTTSNGITTKELLPNSYSFRMTYAFVSNDKAQDISTNSTVVFSTVLCTVTVSNSQSQPVNNVQASYYSGAWRQIGPTVNGQVTKELLPANLTFRITYGTSHQDKTQNLATNNVVGFSMP